MTKSVIRLGALIQSIKAKPANLTKSFFGCDRIIAASINCKHIQFSI